MKYAAQLKCLVSPKQVIKILYSLEYLLDKEGHQPNQKDIIWLKNIGWSIGPLVSGYDGR